MARFQVFDSSVLIPWLRDGSYDNLVATSFKSRRFLLCTVVWMELYAGTRDKADKRDLDHIVRTLTKIGRVVSPQPEEFYAAGQSMAYYGRQCGAIRAKDHANDVLIALCAARADALLVTENREHMETWQRVLKRSGIKLNLLIATR